MGLIFLSAVVDAVRWAALKLSVRRGFAYYSIIIIRRDAGDYRVVGAGR